ncbi:MAG: radical SAM protein [Deltaproteobacteria bacterium]|nr:radical SAM protein [Deltaproteobacteria bacterium]
MQDFSVAFLHPPLSFRKPTYPLGGIFESSTGTTDLLTMMPVGLLSLANELVADGLQTVIVNAAKRLQQRRADGPVEPAELIGDCPARIYGIDLHWSAHASGAIELARACKALHPDAFVLLGGLSATYFADEILSRYPFIDGVICGECDGHMPAIARALLGGRPAETPCLAWREAGHVRRNPAPACDLHRVDYLDRHGLVRPAPRKEALEREALLLSIPVLRGCNQDCLFCGGSRSAYRDFFGRQGYACPPVGRVLGQIRDAVDAGLVGVKLFGDLRLCGREYVEALRKGIAGLATPIDVFIELFWPADESFLRPWRQASRSLHLTLSPESSHPELRARHNKHYDNQAVLDLARLGVELDIDVWVCFAYVLPGHTPETLLAEVDFLERILQVNPGAGLMLQPYLYLDPACEVFEHPAEHGFTIALSSLSGIKAALERAYWFHAIGYRTEAFSELAFFRSILDVTAAKARLYFRHRRLAGRDLLLTMLNLEGHRQMGELIERGPDMDDEALQAAVERIFPAPLRRSNTNLLRRPFLGEAAGGHGSPETLLLDAFPCALEILTRARPEGADALLEALRAWLEAQRARLEGWAASADLPPAVEEQMRALLGPLGLAADFTRDLLAFEWKAYRLLDGPPPFEPGSSPRWKPGLAIEALAYDLVDLHALVDFVLAHGSAPPPAASWYLLDERQRAIWACDFDPREMGERAERARIRRLSALGRRVVAAEATVLRLLARSAGRDEPLRPETAFEGGPLTPDALDALLGS